MIAIDTNILIYAHRAGAKQSRAARHAIEKAVSTGAWGFAGATIAEFWSQVTHMHYPGGPSTPEQAGGFIRSLLEWGGVVFLPRTGFGERLVHTAEELGIRGARVFDLQIGLVARECGAHEIWTHDKHFVQFRGLRVVDPI